MKIAKFLILLGIANIVVILVSIIMQEFEPWSFVVAGLIAFLLTFAGGHSK